MRSIRFSQWWEVRIDQVGSRRRWLKKNKPVTPNMIAGASQADFGVLVVDAAEDTFEAGLKGQTQEHVRLLRSVGVFRLVVAATKLDTSQWNQDQFVSVSRILFLRNCLQSC